jgi:hypothetical protein
VRLPALLREDAGFRRFWYSQTASLAGDQVSIIAIPPVGVLGLHAGPGGMGVLTAAGWAQNLVLSLHAGAWVDRSGRPREAMIAADIGRAALLVTVPVAFAAGALGAPASVAYGSLYGVLVERERLVEAGALVNGSRAGASVAGPSFGGAPGRRVHRPVRRGRRRRVVRRVGVVAAASGGPAARAGRRARRPRRRRPLHRPLGARAPDPWRDRDAQRLHVRDLRAVRPLRDAVARRQPGRARDRARGGAIAGVIGSVVTGRIVERTGVGLAFAAGCVLFTAPLLLIPLAAGPQPVVLGLLLAEFGAGFGVMVLDISAGAILVAAVPETLRARMFGAYQLVNRGVRPSGALGGGALGAAIGLWPTLWIAGRGAVASVLWLVPSPVPRLRALPEA